MQIIGGRARGTKLITPEGKRTRPTAQRSREAIFNLLQGGRLSPALAGAHIIDLFAGSGAIGLEALSRGAEHCHFIEINQAACSVIETNRTRLRMADQSTLHKTGFSQIKSWQAPPADILFSDAPYAENLTVPALTHMAEIGALKEGALLVVETHKKTTLETLPPAFISQDRRHYGLAAISLFNWQASPAGLASGK